MPFREVIGHRRLVGLLSRSVHRDSLPPSLILAGPSGVGKRLVAIATAQALNCTAPEGPGGSGGPDPLDLPRLLEFDACGACPTCRRIARGTHSDVLMVEPGDSGSIKIEQVREIIESAAYRPFEGRRRVVVIDEADALVPAAQNALLKTLEEPPSASQFLLVTSRPDVLLPTVRSRCPCLRFRPLDIRDIAGALVARGRSEAEARAVASASDGSLGRALESSADEVVAARDVAQAVLARAAASTDPVRRLDGAKDLLAGTGSGSGKSDRDQLASNLRAIASLLRDIELLSTAARGPSIAALANSDMRQALDPLVPAYRGDRGLRAFTAIDRALGALERNAGVKIVADWVALQL